MLPSFEGDVCDDPDGDGIDNDYDPQVEPPDLDACNYENSRNYFRVTVRNPGVVLEG